MEFNKTLKKSTIIILLIIIILVQVAVRVYFGNQKDYFHMDEAYSYGLLHYDKLDISENEDFYDNWHTGKYYKEYFTISSEEKYDFYPVYENQKNDVHPPLYYLLLRISTLFTIDSFSKWTGVILNIIIFIFSSIFIYLITKRLCKNTVISLIICFLAGLTLASLESTLYIRMYELTGLWILVTTYLFMRNYNKEKISISNLVIMGVVAVLGSWTHYYYVAFLVVLYLIYMIKYIKSKKYKEVGKLTLTMVLAAAISLLVFPYSIEHVFFGYRGAGGDSAFGITVNDLKGLVQYIYIINAKVFNNLLILILIVCGYFGYKHSKNMIDNIKKGKGERQSKDIDTQILENNEIILLIIPIIMYIIIVSKITPYRELRYIMPICSLIIVSVMYIVYRVIVLNLDIKKTIIITSILSAIIILFPMIIGADLEFSYIRYNNIAKRVEEYFYIPGVYIIKASGNRFSDDIYLFTKLDNSYILSYEEYSKEYLEEVLNQKNTDVGILLFCDEGVDEDKIKEDLAEIKNYENIEYMQRLNAINLYHVY